MNNLLISPAQLTEIGTILQINQAAIPGVYPLNEYEISEIISVAPYFRVAKVNKEVVGYQIAYTSDHKYDGEEFSWFQKHLAQFMYIDQIAVAPSARRLQIGSRLYAEAEKFAHAHQFNRLACEVNLEPPNPASLRFHVGLGFQQLGILSVSDGRTVALLQKKI